ncbi:hypothetical protein RA280_10280 [Cupriavidus sp. CV2]|uniref:hypothetical protein n=1 Tax=Cupriavidus ulmosensis TaxID=3065913 RepID=UPI00296B1E4B|nr:hypothetical protein [Cupriavidus sp. CV2]MDW3682134.1 hypothetical protein [Cupriavidus sp. CV2]
MISTEHVLSEQPFVVRLTPICVRRGARESIDIPAVLRNALDHYRARCAGMASQVHAGEIAS